LPTFYLNGIRQVLEKKLATLQNLTFWLKQTQFTGTRYGFGAPLDLELAVDIPIVPFDSAYGQEKPLANLTIR